MLELGDFVMTHLAYALYLTISIGMTIWVARALSSNGEVFLLRSFGQDTELATSTNRLLVIGFYLVNLGFISYRLGNWEVETVYLVPEVGSRVGISLLVLGLMHFLNMILIARFGRSVKARARDQAGVGQPGFAQPGYGQPGVAQPGAGQPGVPQPGVAQPGVAQPPHDGRVGPPPLR
ncbi:hypothetical protein [Pseudoxanthomonas koreensis]|uniref:hypothetical protein n=1 Tax=Pseudoxanthomonas koreensis TaxID=266061 RepID=UPI0035A5D517